MPERPHMLQIRDYFLPRRPFASRQRTRPFKIDLGRKRGTQCTREQGEGIPNPTGPRPH